MEVNPFVHHIKISPQQKLQIFIMSFTLAPIRFLFAFSLLVITWILGMIFTYGASSDFSTPVCKSRQRLYNILRKLGKAILYLVGASYTVKGKRASSKEAPILVACPHSSYFDIAIWFATGELPVAMTKQENLKIPIIGTLLKAVQPVIVQRTDVKSRANALKKLKDRVSSPGDWPQVIMFPEGTCSNKKRLLKFKRGAFEFGSAIQPFIVRFQNSVDCTTWTEVSESAIKLLWIMMCQLHTNVEVEYLDVYHPSEEEKKNPSLYAENVQKLFSEYLQVPCSEYTYEDRQLMRMAKKLGFPQEHAVVEFFKVKSDFGVNLAYVQDRLKEFSAMMKEKNQFQCDIENFCDYFSLDPSLKCVKRLFKKFDVKNKSKITFREYLRGYCSVIGSLTKVGCEHEVLQQLFTKPINKQNKHKTVVVDLIHSKFGRNNEYINLDEIEKTLKKNPMYMKLIEECYDGENNDF